jgi:uncharacterized protein YdhG (YjbR/CyaY superfamily)
MVTETKRFAATGVDEYLQSLPKKEQTVLENLRRTIKSIVPKAEEVISYQIPTFKYNGGLVGYAAFKDHCGLYVMSPKLMKELAEDLKPYDTATSTVRFTVDRPLPAALVEKIVQARMKENDARLLAKTEKKASEKFKGKLPDAEQVVEYMKNLAHPLKPEIEAVRKIIKTANRKIAERIKWNAPSYYYKQDLVTFNLRATRHVHLVFHHPAIVEIKSDLLQGDYKDRRVIYLRNMQEVKRSKKDLENIMSELVTFIDKQ